jgi:hypothetical protein
VPLRNPDFVGRAELLGRLRRRLVAAGAERRVLPEALHGMGGVGKSQTVVEYIYRYAAEYDLVWWVPAEHATQIRSSFVDLAKRLGILADSAETAVPAVLETLRGGIPDLRWLLVFDNAEHPDVVRPFLPTGLGHVVVTSRNSEWGNVARTTEVELFTRAESKELLRRRAGGSITDEDADRLADALGDLPLAVEQAASWRRCTGMPATEYIDLLEQNSAELLAAGATGEYELSVAAAWNLPLNRLRAEGSGALELLRICAFFSPEPIPRSLFTRARGAPVPPALAEIFSDPIKVNQAISAISRYSLAKVDPSGDTLQLHRLVQAVLRGQLDEPRRAHTRHLAHLVLVSGDPGRPDHSANWPAYAALLPHAISSRAADSADGSVRALVANLNRYLVSAGIGREALTPAGGETPGGGRVHGTHVICAIDIKGYGAANRPWESTMSLRGGMYKYVERAFVQAGIPWDEIYHEGAGDGVLVAVPESVAWKGAFASVLLDSLAAMIREHNEKHPPEEWIRLRLALHLGVITFDDHGPIGHAIILVSRLLAAEPLKAALDRTREPLAVITSEHFYNEVVCQRHEYAPTAYRRVVVAVKETDCFGWIRVPGHELPVTTSTLEKVGRKISGLVRRLVR